jgi:transcriptional regulator with XRE-family HTH domain
MVRLSQKFLIALKLHELPAYKIAQLAGINPTTLSKIVNGIEPLRMGDERILRVAQVLGLDAAEAIDKTDDREPRGASCE